MLTAGRKYGSRSSADTSMTGASPPASRYAATQRWAAAPPPTTRIVSGDPSIREDGQDGGVLVGRLALVGIDLVAVTGVLLVLAGGDLLEHLFGLVRAQLVGQGLGQLGVAGDALPEPVVDLAVLTGAGLVGGVVAHRRAMPRGRLSQPVGDRRGAAGDQPVSSARAGATSSASCRAR